jgi:hypothetical protein
VGLSRDRTCSRSGGESERTHVFGPLPAHSNALPLPARALSNQGWRVSATFVVPQASLSRYQTAGLTRWPSLASSDTAQSSLALCTLTRAGFLTPGLVMRWRPVGRFVFVNGGIGTAFPVLADL